jgi:hypothetical protein
MSLVAISGNASGTGTLTIAAPNTNSDFTLTLPENTGTLISTKSAGTVLQVVSTVKTNTFSTSSASPVDITGLSVSITPSSATSQILVMNEYWCCWNTKLLLQLIFILLEIQPSLVMVQVLQTTFLLESIKPQVLVFMMLYLLLF